MKVAILTYQYPVVSETFVKRHVQKLFGGNTLVLADVPGTQADVWVLSQGGFWNTAGGMRLKWAINLALGRPYNALLFGEQRRLVQALRDAEVDAVLCEFGTLSGVLYGVIQNTQLPLFVFFRGYDATSALRKWQVLDAVKKSVGQAAGVFAVAQFLLDQLKLKGVHPKRSWVCPSGVDTQSFLPQPKAPHSLLYVGRFVEKKQPLLVIRAFAQVLPQHPEAVLTMIGDGPLLAAAQALVEELGLKGRVQFLGACGHDVVKVQMAKTAIFLQHSVTASDGNSEGLPSVIQEAMSCECAIVSTRHAGIPEAVVDGVNGLLVDEHDEQGFARCVAHLLNRPQEQLRMAREARAHAVAHLDCWAIQSRLEAVISALVPQPRQ
jgi:colanic acid/amylovoran biosynthesis glycosyltransferase